LKLEKATPTSKIAGALIWDGFTGKDQIDRQRAVRDLVRRELSEEDQRRLSAILTLTTAELAVMRAG